MTRAACGGSQDCTSHICSWNSRLSFSISSATSAPVISVRIIPCCLACSLFSFSIFELKTQTGDLMTPGDPHLSSSSGARRLPSFVVSRVCRRGLANCKTYSYEIILDFCILKTFENVYSSSVHLCRGPLVVRRPPSASVSLVSKHH